MANADDQPDEWLVSDVFSILRDPHTLRPWTFPDPETVYRGVIATRPYVCYRMDKNDVPQRTSEGKHRWALWTAVQTADTEYRGFRVADNRLARAFNCRAGESSLRRLATQWQIGGEIELCWTRDDRGRRSYRGRYSPLPKA